MHSFVLKQHFFGLIVIIAVIQHKGIPYTKDALFPPILLIFLILLSHQKSRLSYEKQPIIENKEYWRYITCHFTHTTHKHLLLNIIGVVFIWLVFGHYYTMGSFWLVIFISALICMIELHFSETNKCTGLSGIIMGLFTFGVLQAIKHKWTFAYLLLGILMVKTIKEQMIGTKEMNEYLGSKVAIDIHLCGIIGGILGFMLLFLV